MATKKTSSKSTKSSSSTLTYNKIENLYIKFKDRIDTFTKNIRES